MNRQREHLHRDDHPATLELLGALLGHRRDLAYLGVEPTDFGLYIDWDRLTGAGALSSTERATAQIAQGCAALESHHGAPPGVARPLREAIRRVTQ